MTIIAFSVPLCRDADMQMTKGFASVDRGFETSLCREREKDST